MIKMKPQKLLKALSMLVLLAFVLCSPTYAGGGKLTGKVVAENTGEPLIYANIVITHIMQGDKEVALTVPLGGTTDFDGYYVILNIPSGRYIIKASIVGYTSIVMKDVKVDPDRTINLDFQLEPASININEVIVTARKEVIKADVSATQEIVSADRLESLPITRVDEFFGKMKGIQLSSESDGYGLVIRGGKIRETDIRMDGISLQDPRSGNSYLGFNSTSINEVQVLTGGFEAKYGGIRSGLLDVKTKDGSRERFTATIKTDYTYAHQNRFFGTNPFSDDSWIYRIYTGEYAMSGVADTIPGLPKDLRDFKGWGKVSDPVLKALDTLQRIELWKLQHPQYPVADKPDYIIEGTFTGPFIVPNTTFMAGFKYENSQFVYPLGPRSNYEDWNGQLKLTSSFGKSKLSVNGMFAKVFSNTFGESVSYDASQRFSYLNNSTRQSVIKQAGLLAGNSGLLNLFNKSRLQEFEQTFAMGGVKFTHVPMEKMYFTIDFQMGYTGQDITPMLMDMDRDSTQNYFYQYSTKAKKWFTFFNPEAGLPNGSTNPTDDMLKKFKMYGGHQWADSSYSYNYQLKGDVTWQATKYHELQAGFSAAVQRIQVYAGMWNQSSLLFTPNSWQYYKATPLDLGLYVQDKLEFEGMIMNAGLRMDYFNPFKDKYSVGFPQDKDYVKFYTDIYSNLGGSYNSYERWLLFRELIDSPPGWPTSATPGQLKLSPRLGVAFPITETSKMYFNYGHFYQRAATSILYNMKLNAGSTIIPTADMDMARTVQYEFGYEQVFLQNFLFNVTAYYKDISNEPLQRTFVDYNSVNQVSKYYPDGYSDIKGVEVRIERNSGKYFTFNAMYDYMITSEGYAGYSTIYENQVEHRENTLRNVYLYNPKPRPRANVNLNLHTPGEFGQFFGNWLANFFFEWQAGSDVKLNPTEKDRKLEKWVESVNYWNIDFKGSKEIFIAGTTLELSVTIKNLTNNKWLSTGNFSVDETDAYRNELLTNGGTWGDYKSENLAKILANSWENILFLNPRRIIFGARINL